MKKLFYILAVSVCLLNTSCDDFLNTESSSELTPDGTFNSTVYTENVLMGAYAKLTLDKMYGCRMPLNYATNSDIEVVGADQNSYKENTNRGLSNYLGTPGNNSLNFWEEAYFLIERTNLVLEGISGSRLMSGENKEAKAKMLALKGEALTLRAMTYFDLVKNWGDVPFKAEATKLDGSNIYLPVTDRDEIMDTLLVNLKEAIDYLPWLGSSNYSTAERITKGFAKGLRARIALTRGGYSIRNKSGFPTERGKEWEKYYRIANQECQDLLTANVHKLNQSYTNIFERINRLELDNSFRENLFEVAHGLSYSGEMGYSIGIRYNKNSKYGYGNNTNVVCTTAMYFYSFDQKDIRRDATVALHQYSNSTGDLKEFLKAEPLGLNFAKWDQKRMGENWLSQNLAANGKAGYGINWVVMRYADVLLMLAETENELHNGPTEIAKTALKEVRRRAFATADHAEKVDHYVAGLTGKQDFFDAIVNERAWEFGGEAVRKYDLIRWNLLMPKIEESRNQFNQMIKGEEPYAFMPKKLYYKYDQAGECIDVNSLNLFEEIEAPSDKEYLNIAWFSGLSDANKEKFSQMSAAFSNGLKKEVNGAANNRHLFPYSSNTVSDSNGLLKNAYGF